jgi:hypothetical protein
MRWPVFLSSALLAACHAQPIEPSPPAVKATEPVPQVLPPRSQVATLEGAWRVAGIDGAEFNEPYGLALTGSAEELWWDPRCAWIVRSYRIDGDNIAFDPPLNAPRPGEATPPVCTVAPPPRIAEVTRALDDATSVARTEQNGVLISGGGHSVLLFSQ